MTRSEAIASRWLAASGENAIDARFRVSQAFLVQEFRGGDIPEPEGPVVALGRDRLAIRGVGELPFAGLLVPFAPANQTARGHVDEGQLMDHEVPLGLEPESHGGDQLPIGREGEVANLLHSRVDLAQLPPVSCIPDLEVILSGCPSRRADRPANRRRG